MDELTHYKRILILGPPAAGKTTLSYALKAQLNLPLHHMDELYWLENWTRPNEEIFKQKLHNILLNKEWIIEGNYLRYLEQRLHYADAILLINANTLTTLWRASKRFFYRNHKIFRFKVAFKFIFNIITFNKITLPKMHALFTKMGKPVFEFKA